MRFIAVILREPRITPNFGEKMQALLHVTISALDVVVSPFRRNPLRFIRIAAFTEIPGITSRRAHS